jgi:bifunctional non-homologous end joining protein LigD
MVPRFTPMAPTLVPKPFHRDGWVFEEKVDGYRMLAHKDRQRIRLISRGRQSVDIGNPGLGRFK